MKRYPWHETPDGCYHADDLNFQNISTVASGAQAPPRTIASAATIAPTTFLSFVSGTTQLVTITPPVNGAHMLALIFTTTQSGQFATTGNLTVATTTQAVNVPKFLVYDPLTAKYYGA
jgi:hypothetical protein